MSALSALRRLSRRYRRGETGSSTIEFVIVFPVFAFLMMGSYEIGYYTVSSSMLDRGLDLAVRDIRLGTASNVTLSSLKTAVCTYARYVRKCEDNLHIALEPVDANNFVRPAYIAECIDRNQNITPATTFSDGGENELMLVRACVNVDPIFPTTWLGAALEGTPGSGYAMVSTAGFVNEPNT
ncbi:TadE family protein [Celeribacter baekdonensis]|uniref:Pilus assembly protein TadE n=1 Tax=Celeribacter baekdonensis TaxID=875171 RepID=A0A2R4M022_9RHOB|nr:TadE family protein [Celeribacter baekdonensis]AVW90458.1 pilus assembly protein TadE [Celeribacter baekdonensis]|tara:strand:- start:263729 stop:264274 length:546 start_codon:yes stop_codon:yes gene_type:complete